MVHGLEAELGPRAHLAERDVVVLGLAVRRLGLGDVGQRDEQLPAAFVELVEQRLELLELGLDRTGLFSQLGDSGSFTLPVFAASSISAESLFCSARIPSIRVLSSRRRSSTSISSSSCSAASRRARAARTRSESARICFRSSVARSLER